jgi:hypothetical protein
MARHLHEHAEPHLAVPARDVHYRRVSLHQRGNRVRFPAFASAVITAGDCDETRPPTIRRILRRAAVLPFGSRVGRAQAYPVRPVRLVVGFTPGGGNDAKALVNARARSLPVLTQPTADGADAKVTATCPASRSASAGPLPR